MAMSIGQISSAYSLPWVSPSGRVTAAATMISCQPQNTKDASLSEISRAWLVRCTHHRLVANRAEPPKAKITAFVCSGRRRPYCSQEMPSVSAGQYSWAAMITPTSMPTTPHSTVAMANCITTLSL